MAISLTKYLHSFRRYYKRERTTGRMHRRTGERTDGWTTQNWMVVINYTVLKTFSPTFLLIVAKVCLTKRAGPYWSKPTIFTRTWLRYVRVLAIADPSVVCNVRAPYL